MNEQFKLLHNCLFDVTMSFRLDEQTIVLAARGYERLYMSFN